MDLKAIYRAAVHTEPIRGGKTPGRVLRLYGVAERDLQAARKIYDAIRTKRSRRAELARQIRCDHPKGLKRHYGAQYLGRKLEVYTREKRECLETGRLVKNLGWSLAAASRYRKALRVSADAHSEATKATTEALARMARKLGWKITHTSKYNDRVSSRYVEIPGVGVARLSDHNLPKTKQRAYNKIVHGCSWNGEVVVGDELYSKSLTYYKRAIILAAAGR